MQHTSQRYGGFVFDFGRINVILGANGAGKSKLMAEIKENASHLTGGHKAVYIEGGRTIKITDVLQLDHRNVAQFDRLDSAMAHYLSKRTQSLADRVFDALIVLDKKDAQLKSEHSDSVERWTASGCVGDCPRRAQPPLERLFELFSEIFPQIRLSYNTSARQLMAHKNEVNYGPSSLSDGEKQVFSILADLIELDAEHKLIIADEPELNLHPELAERLWTLIENEFPEKYFVYATHSISFALRPNVEKVWVLSSSSGNISQFTDLESLPRSEVVSFLGAIPGILSADNVLVTEGHEKSFDAIFYRWLLEDPKIEIYPAGSCTDVAAVIKKSGLWSRIATSVRLKGVIDSDFRSDDYLESIAAPGVKALPLHEAESYLCIPEVICAIAQRIGSQEIPLTDEEVRVLIFSELEAQKMGVAARRLFAKSQMTVGVSLDRATLAGVSNADELANHIASACSAELSRAEEALSPDRLSSQLQQEISVIDAIISARNCMDALRLLPAKELVRKLAPRAGCKNASDLMRSLGKNFGAEEFAETHSLKGSLLAI